MLPKLNKRTIGALISVLGLLLTAWLPLYAQGGEVRQPAPIPPTGRGPTIDQTKGYFVDEVRDGLYWVTDGSYQVMFLTTGQGVIVVDAPPNMGDKLLAAIREKTSEPVTHLIYSHSHADHIGAASKFPSGITIVAHQDTAVQLRRSNDPTRPVPTVTFADNYLLEVGNQRLELSYKGPAHEPGNIYIYAPRQRVLMVVDIVFPGWVPFMRLALAEDVPAFIQAHDDILAYEFDTLVAGHVTRLGTRRDVEIQKEYVMDVRTNAQFALQNVDFLAVAQRTGFENSWLLFGTYLGEVGQACADRTIPAWVERLAGADIFTRSHCDVMVESLRID